MKKPLGNYTTQPVYMDGIQIGTNESTKNIPLGKQCSGITYNGINIGSIILNPEQSNNPYVDITNITNTEMSIYLNNNGSLQQWITLLTCALKHLKTLEN